MGNGDAVEHGKAFGLWQTLADENGVQAFKVGQDNELLQRGMVPDVALGAGMGITPLHRGLAKKSDIEQIGLTGIDGGCLRLGDRWRDESFLDGVGVDSVVDLGEGSLEVPIQFKAVVFVAVALRPIAWVFSTHSLTLIL